MKTFLASYPFRGEKWSVEIVAEGEAEARERLAALCFAKLDGELVAKIPVPAIRSGILWRLMARLVAPGP